MQIKATALVAFLLLAGCNADNPTAPFPASKNVEDAAEVLGLAGTWSGSGSYYVRCSACEVFGSTIWSADTLRIELADPHPAGEPGVAHFGYELRRHYSPRDWDDEAIAELGLPDLLWEEFGTLGLFSTGGGGWAFHRLKTSRRKWNAESQEYEAERVSWIPDWEQELRLFLGRLVLKNWNYGDTGYFWRVD